MTKHDFYPRNSYNLRQNSSLPQLLGAPIGNSVMTKKHLKLLLLEDEPFDAELNIATLESAGYHCIWERVETRKEFLAALKTPDYDLILIDYNLPGFDGMEALRLLKEQKFDIPILFVTGNLQPELAIDSLKAGALDFVHKDRLERLAPSVARALKEVELRRFEQENLQDQALLNAFYKKANQSASLKELGDFIGRKIRQNFGVFGVTINILSKDEKKLELLNLPLAPNVIAKLEEAAQFSKPALSLPVDRVYEDVFRKERIVRKTDPEFIARVIGDYIRGSKIPDKVQKRLLKIVPAFLGILKMRELIAIPLRQGEHILGLLGIACREPIRDGDLARIENLVEPIVLILSRKMAEEKIADLQRSHQLLLDSTAEGILGMDMEGNPIFVNPAAAKILGYEVNELLNQKSHFLYHRHADELDGEIGDCPMYQGSTLRNKPERPVHFWRKDGTSFPISFVNAPILDEGKQVGVVLAFQDITEQVEATREIARLAQIVEQAQISVAMTDLGANMIYVNPFFEQITGYSKEEALGENPRILQSGYHDIAFYQKMWAALTAGKAWRDILINKRKDGTLYYEDASIFPIKAENDEVINYAAVKRDITAEMEAEKALEEEKNFSERIIQTSTAIIVGLDYQRKIRLFNRGAEKITGYTQEEVLGKDWFDIFLSGEITEEMDEVWADAWEQENVYSYVNPIWSKDGTKKTISWQNTKLDEGLEIDKQLMISIGTDITQRVEAEEQVRLQLSHLDALYHIDTTILANMDASFSLRVILEEVKTQLKIDAIDLLLYQDDTDTLVFAAKDGFRSDALLHTQLKIGQGLAGKAVLDRRIVHISNLDESEHFKKFSPAIKRTEKFIAYWGVPLLAKGKIMGVLELFHRTSFAPSGTWKKFMAMLAEQVAVAVYNISLFQDLRTAYDETLQGWARALELRDMETEGHSRRVTNLTVELATAMGIGKPEIEHIRRGALLHDIGKMGIPDAILHKAGPLTDDEWEIMRQHPVYAYDMLREIPFLAPALDIPHYHHERWDGSGYPDGLKGEEIPLPARIFAVVDVYDALTNDRCYRKAWSKAEVEEKIRAESGKHFDPAVVEVFFNKFILDEEFNE